jgi:AcrR family transcriptional regulator
MSIERDIMARKKASNKTKEKILIAAKEVFVEYGYEDAKVNDIAKRADVTKTMLYYHYNSKENMLNEIIGETLTSIVNALESKMKDVDVTSEVEFSKFISDMADVWYDNRGIVKLILLQTLKDETYANKIMQMLEGFYDKVLDVFSIKDRESINFNLFFFNTMPMVMYSVLNDSYETEIDKKKEFVDAFTKTFYNTIK